MRKDITQIRDNYDKKKLKIKEVLVVFVPHLLVTHHDKREKNKITSRIITFYSPSKDNHMLIY